MTTFKLTPARPDRLALRGVGFVPSVALSIDVDDLPNEPVVATVLGAYVDESPGHIRIGCLFENGSRLELGHWPSWSAACDLAVERAEELYENSVPIVFDKWLDDGRKTKLDGRAGSFNNIWRNERGQFAHKGHRNTEAPDDASLAIEELANPWRDAKGRFAPKGYGSVGTTESDVSDAASPVDEDVSPGGEGANPWDDVKHTVVPTWDENGNVIVDPKAKVLAKDLREKAEKVEPEISTRLAELAGDENPVSYDPPPDGELYGFEYRLKAEDKIAEKIMRELAEKPETLQGDIIAASQEIKDAVRYTIHFKDEDFGDRAQSIVDTLRDEGATINVKNTWPPELGKSYKGINAQVTQSDGLRYEVQFHTENSQAVKDTMHKIYEQQRVLPNGSPEWTKLENEMAALSRDLPVPTGAVEVFEIDGEVV